MSPAGEQAEVAHGGSSLGTGAAGGGREGAAASVCHLRAQRRLLAHTTLPEVRAMAVDLGATTHPCPSTCSGAGPEPSCLIAWWHFLGVTSSEPGCLLDVG